EAREVCVRHFVAVHPELRDFDLMGGALVWKRLVASHQECARRDANHAFVRDRRAAGAGGGRQRKRERQHADARSDSHRAVRIALKLAQRWCSATGTTWHATSRLRSRRPARDAQDDARAYRQGAAQAPRYFRVLDIERMYDAARSIWSVSILRISSVSI